jgi:hypothetical protein
MFPDTSTNHPHLSFEIFRVVSFFTLFLFSMSLEAQRPERKTFHKQLLDHYNPATLTEAISPDEIGTYKDHYIQETLLNGIRITQVNAGEVVSEWTYSFAGSRVTEVSHHSFAKGLQQDSCRVKFLDDMRHTRCYTVSGKLKSEEWYNLKTTEYQFATYNDAGEVVEGEHGSYRPKDDQ